MSGWGCRGHVVFGKNSEEIGWRFQKGKRRREDERRKKERKQEREDSPTRIEEEEGRKEVSR